MIETNRLFFGRIWTVQNYLGNGIYNVKQIQKKYMLLYLTKHKFFISNVDAFKDIESGKYYSIDLKEFATEKFFINTEDIKPLVDVFPTVYFPPKLTKKQILIISEIYNKMQSEIYDKEEEKQMEIKNNSVNEIKTRVLTKKW